MKSEQSSDEVAAAMADLIQPKTKFSTSSTQWTSSQCDFILKLVLGFHSKELNMRENKLADLSMLFAVNALNLANSVEGHYSLKNQFERSATSIGANIREANYAQSKADFLSKLQIALKECYETEYWLELFVKAKIVEEVKVKNLLHDCGELRHILVASITTLKSK